MVNPRMRKCQAPSCNAHATFKDVDAIHPTACATHKLDDMVHVRPVCNLEGWLAGLVGCLVHVFQAPHEEASPWMIPCPCPYAVLPVTGSCRTVCCTCTSAFECCSATARSVGKMRPQQVSYPWGLALKAAGGHDSQSCLLRAGPHQAVQPRGLQLQADPQLPVADAHRVRASRVCWHVRTCRSACASTQVREASPPLAG